MKFEIIKRFTGEIIFTAEIECDANASHSVKLGLAVKVGIKARANLAGADLARANLAGANLAGADLAGADLAGADLARAYLAGADLASADLARANLAGANLAGADLARADLAGANLAGANLAGADLAGAKNVDLARSLKIDPADIPVIQNIDAAILSAIDAGGSLDMDSWHTCATTHCRAGWAIHLAGDKGRVLEEQHGSFMAGCLIYSASRPGIAPPHFYASTDAAMDDIRKCAAEQTGVSP